MKIRRGQYLQSILDENGSEIAPRGLPEAFVAPVGSQVGARVGKGGVVGGQKNILEVPGAAKRKFSDR